MNSSMDILYFFGAHSIMQISSLKILKFTSLVAKRKMMLNYWLTRYIIRRTQPCKIQFKLILYHSGLNSNGDASRSPEVNLRRGRSEEVSLFPVNLFVNIFTLYKRTHSFVNWSVSALNYTTEHEEATELQFMLFVQCGIEMPKTMSGLHPRNTS